MEELQQSVRRVYSPGLMMQEKLPTDPRMRAAVERMKLRLAELLEVPPECVRYTDDRNDYLRAAAWNVRDGGGAWNEVDWTQFAEFD